MSVHGTRYKHAPSWAEQPERTPRLGSSDMAKLPCPWLPKWTHSMGPGNGKPASMEMVHYRCKMHAIAVLGSIHPSIQAIKGLSQRRTNVRSAQTKWCTQKLSASWGHEPWAMAWLHGHSLVVWLIENNGSGAVERPARGSMMPSTVACISHSYSTVLLVLYPYLDPMDGQMPDSHTYTVHSHSLVQHSVGPDQSEPQAQRH